MTKTGPAAPDQRALLACLESPRFRSGVDSGKWRVVAIEWPYVYLAVSAAPRGGAHIEYGLRAELTGYPQQPPACTAWSLEHNRQLTPDERPKGERAGDVFKHSWKEGEALYAPWDRSCARYSDWATKHPALAWHAGRDLTFVLRQVHDLLNDVDETDA